MQLVPDYGQTYNFFAISHSKARSEATEVGMEGLEKTLQDGKKTMGFILKTMAEDGYWFVLENHCSF